VLVSLILPSLCLEFVECVLVYLFMLILQIKCICLGWVMFMLNVCSLDGTNSWIYALLNCIMKLDCNFRLVGIGLVD